MESPGQSFENVSRRASLLAAVLRYLLEEGIVDLVAADLPQGLALGDDHAVVLAARNTVIRVPRLAGPVHDAAHDGHGEVVLVVLEPLLGLGGVAYHGHSHSGGG